MTVDADDQVVQCTKTLSVCDAFVYDDTQVDACDISARTGR
jgi:hypothetical protein